MKKYLILNHNDERGNFVYKLSFQSSDKMYIGITNDPKRRVRQHINAWSHKKSKDYYASKWIHKYIEAGDILIMEILESCPTYENIKQREVELIAEYRNLNANLVNILDGGEGTPGRDSSK
jgi:predicted GIY-YIG superfamily endonuclease